MKHIVKHEEPQEFSDWKNLVNENWQPTYDDLSGYPKKALKNSLMAEQGYICCYCERRLTDNESHIEHFRPQSDPAVDPLGYANLLCSCQNQLNKGEPRHCGNKKEDWFDEQLLVSPLSPDCANRFAFNGDGRIQPRIQDDLKAITTIKKLNLDIPKLNDLRSKAIEPFLDETLSEDEIKRFVSGYLLKDANGMLGEFWTTINHLFGAYAVL